MLWLKLLQIIFSLQIIICQEKSLTNYILFAIKGSFPGGTPFQILTHLDFEICMCVYIYVYKHIHTYIYLKIHSTK